MAQKPLTYSIMGKKVVLLVGDAVEDYEVPLYPVLQCHVSRSS